jgi:hypothetical protein
MPVTQLDVFLLPVLFARTLTLLTFYNYNEIFIIILYTYNYGSQGSSASLVSGYGLDDRMIEVRSPAEAREFSSNLCVQTGCGAHRASCPMGTGGPFPRGKARQGLDADHSPPFSAEVVNE